MFTFRIISTIDASDDFETISKGSDLYVVGDNDHEVFATVQEALDRADEIMSGLDGGPAYRMALASANIVAVEFHLADLGLHDDDIRAALAEHHNWARVDGTADDGFMANLSPAGDYGWFAVRDDQVIEAVAAEARA